MPVHPQLHLLLRDLPGNGTVDHGAEGTGRGDSIDEAVGQSGLSIHPGGFLHHLCDLVTPGEGARRIHVDDAVLAGPEQADGFHEIGLVADGSHDGIVDHEERTRRHFQGVRRHGQHCRRRSRRAADGDADLSRIGHEIVVHANGGVAAAAIGVQPNMHVLRLVCPRLIKRLMKAVRCDLVAEPHFIVYIAVQVDFPHSGTTPFLFLNTQK